MKLLFDQNISFRIVKNIIKYFPGSEQVRKLGLEEATDIEIWNYALKNEYAIVTFDADFYDFSMMKGVPPKVIWLRIGNTTTNNIKEIITAKTHLIKEFCNSEDMKNIGCLEIRD